MITIKRVEWTDIEWLRQQRNNPELYQYFNQYREIGKDEQEKWFLGLSHTFHPFIAWNDNEKVGYVGLRDIDNILRSAEFSIFICPEHRNKGYGKQALQLLLKYGFETLNLIVIHSLVFEFNKAIETYKKFGFKMDGKLRRTCYKNGRYWDSWYISMLREEYDELYNSIK